MGSTRDRDDFIRIMTQEAPQVSGDDLRRFMRYATTLHRLSEAQCNGDYPCDNGERVVAPCKRCEGMWVPYTLTKDGICRDCRTQDLVTAAATRNGLGVEFQGDPRGGPFFLKVPSGRTDDWGQRGIYVPAGSGR